MKPFFVKHPNTSKITGVICGYRVEEIKINLFDIYLPIVEQVLIFDNSEGNHQLIAEKSNNEDVNIIDLKKFNEIKNTYDNRRKN